MKTVSKKLLSLLLVAMLLVSAVPFQALAEEAGYTVKIVVHVNESTTETLSFDANSEAEMLAWRDLSAEDIVDALKDEGELSYVDPSKDQIDGFANTPVEGAKTLTWNLWITTSSGTTPPAGGETAEEFTLTVDTGLGTYTKKATYGDKYLDVLAPPARPGYEFKGWKSEALDRMIKSDDYIESDDTVIGVWSNPTKYNLTLDPNRGIAEDVNYGVQVVYGEEIYAKVAKYQPEREGYVFVGWKLNGKIIKTDTVYELQGDATAYAEWKLESDTEDEPMGGTTHEKTGKVYLEIYVNNDTANLKKRVDITTYANDDKITRAEAQAVVKKYITAKAGYTLSYDGLFDEDGWWWYTRDPETNGKEYIIVNRDGDDYVYVMVNNVKVVAGDPSNPKTGDMMLPIAMTMMLVSGMAAAAVYVVGKKRRV